MRARRLQHLLWGKYCKVFAIQYVLYSNIYVTLFM